MDKKRLESLARNIMRTTLAMEVKHKKKAIQIEKMISEGKCKKVKFRRYASLELNKI